ncbi:D-alanyl-D-alanine carboxypeptidase family protein [Gracilibacillus salitolerans]|uniref:D-alanyl-D-alanine carboxypeptidase family protein n=1 Tax=Gracilibacillus salitolerans TaxID=2663022 RepID=A0A5Q2TNK6_9BACI|nr:M15 family metallopeptidase [Gracilibacillus salitolerans]QGH35741.1 D-alanyl-D-alanine carboxypeptidase family protein [Gracilibacillus salitolerans]
MKKTVIFIMLTAFLIGCQQEDYLANQLEKRNVQHDYKKEPEAFVPADDTEETEEKEEENQNQEENQQTDENANDSLTVIDDPNSVSLVVNKQRKLPDGFEPDDLVEADVPYHAAEGDPKRLLRKVAADALDALFVAAKEDDLDLVAVSGYRSYDRQKQIYESNVATNGQAHADKFSAKPGTSEHQTGLAMDVASAALVAVLEQSFIETDEGQWLEDHAHEHGFIIRYPEGKEDITGYSYEPWHLRYVGKEIATEIYQAQITLEEYFGLYP